MSEAVLTVESTGFDGFLDGVVARVDAAANGALSRGGLVVLAEAVAGAPVRSGHLRGSGESRTFRGWPTAMNRVRFPGPYARRQHFELSWRHPHGGHALYLYLAQATKGQAVIDLISEAVRGAL